MKDMTHVSTVTDRGQISIPADLRRRLGLEKGRRLLWEVVGDDELRVRALDDAKAPGATAALGFARRLRRTPRRTREWMAELRGAKE